MSKDVIRTDIDPLAVRGLAAILEMLDCIGNPEIEGDHAVAKILVENEMELRSLVRFAAGELSQLL